MSFVSWIQMTVTAISCNFMVNLSVSSVLDSSFWVFLDQNNDESQEHNPGPLVPLSFSLPLSHHSYPCSSSTSKRTGPDFPPRLFLPKFCHFCCRQVWALNFKSRSFSRLGKIFVTLLKNFCRSWRNHLDKKTTTTTTTSTTTTTMMKLASVTTSATTMMTDNRFPPILMTNKL